MPKQLGELLREQQEPFVLEAYLLDRGFSRKELSSRSFSGNSKSFLSRSASLNLNKKSVIPSCSKIVKAVLNKLGTGVNKQRKRDSVNRDGNSGKEEITSREQETAVSERFSSASSATVFNSCSESDAEQASDSTEKNEVVTDREEHHSPVSVLEELPSYEENSILHNKKQLDSDTRDSILPVPFCEFIFQPSKDKPSCTESSSQYLEAKRVFSQSKQLLFDCMREMMETHVRDTKGRQLVQFLGPEELGKLLCEDMRTWSGLSGNETNTTQLLNYDFTASVREWRDFELQVRKIGPEVGDAILEDISREIVVDMIELVKTTFGEAGG